MTRGALLFAFNSPKYDYYAMAEHTAKRINHFLNMPVTLVRFFPSPCPSVRPNGQEEEKRKANKNSSSRSRVELSPS